MKDNLLNLTPGELEKVLTSLGEPKYRARQIFSSIHKKNSGQIEKIIGIPPALKEKLAGKFHLNSLKTIRINESEKFKTKKFLFEIDGRQKKYFIETVLISEKGRNTICISTQVGCNAGCEFCATGKMGFIKNLEVSEIISQVYEVKRQTGIEPTNIVYMGMGEPFLNYDNMFRSLEILTDEKGIGLSSKRITVSTVGFKNRISKFADDLTKPENIKVKNVKLALSLHSTDNGLRESIIPTSKIHSLSEIYKELIYFYQKTRNKITYEYIFFEGLNDKLNDIKRLEKISKMIPSNINVIPFHPIDFELKKPLDIFNRINTGKDINKLLSNKKLFDFIAELKKRKVTVNLRSSSGIDINAACGQLSVAQQK